VNNTINQQARGEIARIRRLASMEFETREASEDWREPLAIDERVTKTVLLSWGGPSDGFEIDFVGGIPAEGRYFRANWGEHETSPLTPDELMTMLEVYSVTAE
jgi:hypothetical protein